MLRTVPAQSTCSTDVDVQVSLCCDNKNLHSSVAYKHPTFLAHGSAGVFALRNAVCHDSAVAVCHDSAVGGFLILGPGLAHTASEMVGDVLPMASSHLPLARAGPVAFLRTNGCCCTLPTASPAEKGCVILLQKRELILGDNYTIYYSWRLLLTSSPAGKFPCTISFKAML